MLEGHPLVQPVVDDRRHGAPARQARAFLSTIEGDDQHVVGVRFFEARSRGSASTSCAGTPRAAAASCAEVVRAGNRTSPGRESPRAAAAEAELRRGRGSQPGRPVTQLHLLPRFRSAILQRRRRVPPLVTREPLGEDDPERRGATASVVGSGFFHRRPRSPREPGDEEAHNENASDESPPPDNPLRSAPWRPRPRRITPVRALDHAR